MGQIKLNTGGKASNIIGSEYEWTQKGNFKILADSINFFSNLDYGYCTWLYRER